MSRKNKFKQRKESAIAEVSHGGSHQKTAEKSQDEYNTKSDFINLFIIIIFYTGIILGLYYYDMQSHILAAVADRLMNSI